MHISQYLEKFSKLGFKERASREVIALVLSEVFSMPLTKDNVLLKDTVVVLKASPSVRNAVFMKKEQLLALFREKLPGVTLTDIR